MRRIFAIFGLVLLLGAGSIAWRIYNLPSQANLSQTLEEMYAEDQAVRFAGLDSPMNIARFVVGDWFRVRRVRRMVSAEILRSADDYANAAKILQHGSAPSDFLNAKELSQTAYELGREDMLSHGAAAEDRYLIEIGKAQKYGSQFHCIEGEGWQLQAVDPAVSDDERVAVNRDTLADMQTKIEQLNTRTKQACAYNAELPAIIESVMEGTP